MSTRECLVTAYEALNSAMQLVTGRIERASEPDQVANLSFELRTIIREMDEVKHMIGIYWNSGRRGCGKPVDKKEEA